MIERWWIVVMGTRCHVIGQVRQFIFKQQPKRLSCRGDCGSWWPELVANILSSLFFCSASYRVDSLTHCRFLYACCGFNFRFHCAFSPLVLLPSRPIPQQWYRGTWRPSSRILLTFFLDTLFCQSDRPTQKSGNTSETKRKNTRKKEMITLFSIQWYTWHLRAYANERSLSLFSFSTSWVSFWFVQTCLN